MKKTIIIAITVIALVACLAVARWADQRTQIPSSTPAPTATATTTPTELIPPSSSTTAPTLGDIENGLGWG